MKISQILYKIIITTILIIMCASCVSYADNELVDDGGGSQSENTSKSNGLPEIGDGYRPNVELGDQSRNVISKILGALQVVGAIMIVVSISLIGYNTIMGSANEKAIAQEKYIGLFVAASIIMGGSTIAKLIASVAETL